MRTINADALTTWIKESQRMTSKVKAILCYIETMPSQNRPQGEWIWQLANNGWVDHICSVCGYTENTDIHISLGWKYCPNCGAEMKGAYDETY